MTLNLKIWRQAGPDAPGQFMEFQAANVSSDMSFLEMLDVVNEDLVRKGESAIEFDHDCREGICGACSLVINGNPHGPDGLTTTCQLHMRRFNDGDTLVIEPFRAKAFPVVKDLVVDRSALDRIQRAGGFISANTGAAPDANSIPVPKAHADRSFASATCISCGACVAVCKNASAALFTSAKMSHLALLPQGQAERQQRALSMVAQMDAEAFGACSNTGACEAVCPVGISLENIARMNREYLVSSVKDR
ncbi:MAG: succinate dehydrogenase/fumarate reductase iron-sulfur subunit [Bdellovibrionales bacterium]